MDFSGCMYILSIMNKSRGIWKQAILLMKVAQFVDLVPRPSTQLMLLAVLAGTRLTESLYLLWRRWSILERGKCTVPVGSSSSCRGRWVLPPYCRMEGTHRACGSVCVGGGGGGGGRKSRKYKSTCLPGRVSARAHDDITLFHMKIDIIMHSWFHQTPGPKVHDMYIPTVVKWLALSIYNGMYVN